MESLICKFIKSHPDSWIDEMNSLNIKIKYKDYFTDSGEKITFAIFNYGVDADFSNPIVQEARGIIIRLDTVEPVCWPFRKFGNWSESYADKIDWSHAEVQQKIDGSLVKLWYNSVTNQWQWSTNGMIDAADASISSNPSKTFLDLINEAIDQIREKFDYYIKSPFLQKNITAMFELVSPENKIVINYPKTELYYLGTKQLDNGLESYFNYFQWIFPCPKLYPLHTFDECMLAAEALNKEDNITDEGFVVVDNTIYEDGWHRVKIKSPLYVAAHHAVANNAFSKDKAVKFILNGMDEDRYPDSEIKCIIKYYRYALNEFEYKVEKYINYVRGLNQELNGDRKAVANMIKKDRLSMFGFKSLDTTKSASELIKMIGYNRILQFLPDYKLPNLKEIKEWLPYL